LSGLGRLKTVCKSTLSHFESILTPNLTDSSYVPSSQGEETACDEGIHKQLRIYRSGEDEESDNDIQIHQWVEKRRSLLGGYEATDFLWTTPNP